MKRINFYLSDKQIKNLQLLSKETGLSVSELARRAIDLFLDKEGIIKKRNKTKIHKGD